MHILQVQHRSKKETSCPYIFLFACPESLRGRHPRKMGKNYKCPSPVRTPKIGKIAPNKRGTLTPKMWFCNFSVFFPQFRGSDRGGEFCNFSSFLGDFHARGFQRPPRIHKGNNFDKRLRIDLPVPLPVAEPHPLAPFPLFSMETLEPDPASLQTPIPCPSFPCFCGIPCFFPLRGFPCFFVRFSLLFQGF